MSALDDLLANGSFMGFKFYPNDGSEPDPFYGQPLNIENGVIKENAGGGYGFWDYASFTEQELINYYQEVGDTGKFKLLICINGKDHESHDLYGIEDLEGLYGDKMKDFLENELNMRFV